MDAKLTYKKKSTIYLRIIKKFYYFKTRQIDLLGEGGIQTLITYLELNICDVSRPVVLSCYNMSNLPLIKYKVYVDITC